ncbi:MAG: class A beta-lactamase-related serine hydrolase [Candidatus Yanofskybacteria bacterium]|nr:class A beta-lactamase-related serine hydrolase [Candidatus Yanofskybacteria bacterium]
MERNRLLMVAIAIFAIGTALGWLSSDAYTRNREANAIDQIKVINGDPQYRFIRPLLGYEAPEAKNFGQYEELDAKLNEVVADAQRKNVHASVYFRDLALGAWIGVNQDEQYAPASLLKVPLLIYYLKLAEKDSKILEEQVTVNIKDDVNSLESIKSTRMIVSGRSYSVRELLEYMIQDSDNNAMYALFSHANQNTLAQILLSIGIQIPPESKPDFVSVKTYAQFFRILYNITFLNKDMSEYALNILSKTTYVDGLAKPIPATVPLVHKFGEFSIKDDPNSHELHDCGIIYTSRPYLLCIMTRGSNPAELQNTIQKISEVTYTEISSHQSK